jgi:hypothetical protein
LVFCALVFAQHFLISPCWAFGFCSTLFDFFMLGFWFCSTLFDFSMLHLHPCSNGFFRYPSFCSTLFDLSTIGSWIPMSEERVFAQQKSKYPRLAIQDVYYGTLVGSWIANWSLQKANRTRKAMDRDLKMQRNTTA